MPKSDSMAKSVMRRMLRSAIRLTMVSVLFFGLTGCEDEPPPMQRGGGPDPVGSPPAAKKAEKPEASNQASSKKKPTADADVRSAAAGVATTESVPSSADDQRAASSRKGPLLPPRVPSASEILGMDRDDNQKAAADRLPTFLTRDKTAEPKLLFDGKEPIPSDAYSTMGQEGMLEVSPLQRHWGGALRMSDVGAKKRLLTNTMAAPNEEDDTTLFGPSAALEPESAAEESSGAKKASRSNDKKFELTMYRLNKKLIKVDSVTRTYATAAARDAARSFLVKDGYSNKQPSPSALMELREAQKKAAAKKKANEQAKNTCPFRATWTDNGITNSRCFKSAEALSKFQKSLQKKRQVKQKSQGSSRKAKDGQRNSTLRQNAIEPVKIK